MRSISSADIKEIFDSTDPKGALDCLADHRLFAEFPLIDGTAGRTRNKGYFKVRACNLIPGAMSIPSANRRLRGKSRP